MDHREHQKSQNWGWFNWAMLIALFIMYDANSKLKNAIDDLDAYAADLATKIDELESAIEDLKNEIDYR